MELAKELFTDVVSERFQLATVQQQDGGAATDTVEKTAESALVAEANRFLEGGMPVAVHVLMGHEGCKANDGRELCPAMQRLEVWNFRLHRGRPPDAVGRPPMLPLFLKQALRSQLHFSPFRSWLAANPLPEGLVPVIKISTGDQPMHWKMSDQVQSHQFPACCLVNSPICTADSLWLQIGVQWLKRENFLQKAPLCPTIEMDCNDDAWVLPPPSPPTGCGASEDPSPSCSDSEHSNNDSLPNSPTQRWKEGGGGETHSRRQLLTRRSNKTAAALDHHEAHRAERSAATMDQQQQKVYDVSSNSTPTTGRARARTPMAPAFRARTSRLLLPSSPVPPPTLLRRRIQQAKEAAEKGHHVHNISDSSNRTTVNNTGTTTSSTSNGNGEDKGQQQGKWPRPMPAQRRLICNFEESILNGRLLPSSIVDGYRLQLTVVPEAHSTGFFSVQRVCIPVQACFYNEMGGGSSGEAMAPGSLHLARCELAPAGIPIPRRCNLQAVLFNPQGSVVKLFMVNVDLSDMPSGSTTFIRQRTFNESGIAKKTADEGVPKTTGNTMAMASLPKVPTTTALRFLIHLRLASDEAGKVRLHTDIRMLFSNKSNDLEGLETILGGRNLSGNGKMNSVAEMPERPKYSPVK